MLGDSIHKYFSVVLHTLSDQMS